MSADRARDFLTRIEASNLGAETLDQLIDDVRRLVTTYNHQPLPTLLGDLVDTQERAFGLLEGRQRPEQSRDLYLVAGIAFGLMAKASHDLGASHDAILNWPAEAHTALARATDLRDQVQPDELDGLGGTCTFSRPRQLYFAAEALSWGGEPEATSAERLALEALDDYARRVGAAIA